LIIISSATSANAQPVVNKVLARELFEQGRELAKVDKWAEACPKFEASLRYDATLGTRVNLATCYEKLGKLASAWSLFRDSADLASQTGDTARRDYALQQVAALLPRLPKLTIAGPMTPPPGLVITRDGVAFDVTALGAPLYVDPGPHEVTALAPGFEPFKATITVGEAASETVVINELTPSIPVVQPEQPPPETPRKEPEKRVVDPLRQEVRRRHPDVDDRTTPGRTQKLVGISIAGGGAALIGVGLFFGSRASSTYHDAESLCGASLICESDADFEKGKHLIDRARTQATFSTVLVITGVAAATAGAVVWVTAPKRERAETTVLPIVTDHDLGIAVAGRF